MLDPNSSEECEKGCLGQMQGLQASSKNSEVDASTGKGSVSRDILFFHKRYTSET